MTGGAPTLPDTIEYFYSLDIPIINVSIDLFVRVILIIIFKKQHRFDKILIYTGRNSAADEVSGNCQRKDWPQIKQKKQTKLKKKNYPKL